MQSSLFIISSSRQYRSTLQTDPQSIQGKISLNF